MQAADAGRSFLTHCDGGTHSPRTPFADIYIHVKEQEIKKHLKHLVNYLKFPQKLSDQWGPLQSSCRREWQLGGPEEGEPRSVSRIPMVCFTETPLGFLGHHMNKYNEYGIGMTLSWGIRNGGFNVVYCDNKYPNFFAKSYGKIINKMQSIKDNDDRSWHTSIVGITEDIENRQEREWRIIGYMDNLIHPTKIIPESVSFQKEDIVAIVAPAKELPRLRTFIESQDCYNNYEFALIRSELLKDNFENGRKENDTSL